MVAQLPSAIAATPVIKTCFVPLVIVQAPPELLAAYQIQASPTWRFENTALMATEDGKSS